MTERIFRAAKAAFGKNVFAAWPQIIGEAEHALWVVWNPRYGPLNAEQREYATSLVCFALNKAVGHPNPYGAYYTWLRSAYNHETVDAGFKSRRTVETAVEYGPLLGEVA